MDNLQFNNSFSFSALTRIRTTRLAFVAFVALLAVWQGGVFGYVPDGMMFNGPETITATVPDNTTEKSANLLIVSGTRTIFKTGGGTWELNRANITTSPTINLQEGTINFNGSASNIQVSAYLNMAEGTTLISNVNNHVLDTASTANNVMYNLQGAGNIIVSSGNSFGVSMTAGQHTAFTGTIQGEGNVFAVYSKDKTQNSCSLTLSGDNAFTGKYAVRFGARLILTDDAVNANGDVYVDQNSVVEYNVKNGTKRLDLANGKVITGYASGSPPSTAGNWGKIEKSGPGVLQIYSEAYGAVKAESFVISSGRMDFQGYFDFAGSGLFVEDGAVFSPGLSDNNTIGNAIIKSAITLETGATALFEFDSYSDNPDSSQYDTLTIDNFYGLKIKFNTQTDSFIKLAFLNNDAEKWAKEGAEYRIIADERDSSEYGTNIVDGDYTFLLGNYTNMFELRGKAGQGLFLVGLGAPVPEPSTWALLFLGVAGLMYVRKRVRN